MLNEDTKSLFEIFFTHFILQLVFPVRNNFMRKHKLINNLMKMKSQSERQLIAKSQLQRTYCSTKYSSNGSLQTVYSLGQIFNTSFGSVSKVFPEYPKYSNLFPASCKQSPKKSQQRSNPQQLLLMSKLKVRDTQYQNLLIQEKEIQLNLYNTENQLVDLKKEAHSLLSPLLMIQQQIQIHKKILQRRHQQLKLDCNRLSSGVEADINELNVELQKEYLDYQQLVESEEKALEEQLFKYKQQVQKQRESKANLKMKLFDLQQIVKFQMVKRKQRQRKKMRTKLLVIEQNQKMAIYKQERQQLLKQYQKSNKINRALSELVKVKKFHEESIYQIGQHIKNEKMQQIKLIYQNLRLKNQNQARQIPSLKKKIQQHAQRSSTLNPKITSQIFTIHKLKQTMLKKEEEISLRENNKS